MGKSYYFAYGIHMRREEMEALIPGHQVYGLAYLENHQLLFNTFSNSNTLANIATEALSKVYGLLYEIQQTDWKTIDLYHSAHQRVEKKIYIPGIKAHHMAYLYEAKSTTQENPALAYIYKIFHAARIIPGYNPRYLNELENWLLKLKPEL